MELFRFNWRLYFETTAIFRGRWDAEADLSGAATVREGAPFPVVLVVGDEAVIRAILAEELEDAGFTVVEADSADAAVAAFAGRSDIGVVVTNVRMPG